MTTVTLYGKPGCCLCDEAKEALAAIRARRPFDLDEVDITRDPALERDYRERIPVVAIDGEPVCELYVDAEGVEERLARVTP
jgi:glutaredoxin